ncbi:MAG: phosphotransferase [Pirellulaceae bacterium]
MIWIDEQTAQDYLRATGRIASQEEVRIRELAGGVSNVVLLVADARGLPRFVLKQAREQLRVADPWFCSVTRILREVEVLKIAGRALQREPARLPNEGLAVGVPEVLFCDAENFAFAMTAAPPHQVWKEQLLAGACEPQVASACGSLLGSLHATTWHDAESAAGLADRTFFDALRLDPYYRHVARQREDLALHLERIIASVDEHVCCLVHGDYSPKNLLVSADRVTLVDCEVGHFGDPAFDLGFFLSHLVLKAVRAEARWWDYVRLTFVFWHAYEDIVKPVMGAREFGALVARTVDHFAACCLARIDGKSKVDYLQESQRCRVRKVAERLFLRRPATWSAAVADCLPLWPAG